MKEILEEIRASRKNIGLAGIEMARKTGGVAGSDGGPGEESETGEAQGNADWRYEFRSAAHRGITFEGGDIGFRRVLHNLNARGSKQRRGANLYAIPQSLSQCKTGLCRGGGKGRGFQCGIGKRVKDYIDAIANTGE